MDKASGWEMNEPGIMLPIELDCVFRRNGEGLCNTLGWESPALEQRAKATREMEGIYEQTETEEPDVGLYRFRMDPLNAAKSASGFSSGSHSITDDMAQGKDMDFIWGREIGRAHV